MVVDYALADHTIDTHLTAHLRFPKIFWTQKIFRRAAWPSNICPFPGQNPSGPPPSNPEKNIVKTHVFVVFAKRISRTEDEPIWHGLSTIETIQSFGLGLYRFDCRINKIVLAWPSPLTWALGHANKQIFAHFQLKRMVSLKENWIKKGRRKKIQ